ncbi:uncharacterized protein LOC144909025 isoform X1 [Branchiostoma floridae x Branchiostoma belcheri]
MSDGSGRISLHSLASPEEPYELDSNSYRFLYSPCTAMKNAKQECREDTSVCLEGREEDFGYNFGSASDPEFITDKTGNVTVKYTSHVGNKTRTAKVRLVCDPSVTERPLVMFKGMTETAMNVPVPVQPIDPIFQNLDAGQCRESMTPPVFENDAKYGVKSSE